MRVCSWNDTEALVEGLGKNGFCVVEGGDALMGLQNMAKEIVRKAKEFLTQEEESLRKFTWGRLGVQVSKGKRGLRALSGTSLKHATNTPLPEELGLSIWGERVDGLIKMLIRRLAEKGLFGNVAKYERRLCKEGVSLYRGVSPLLRGRDKREFGMIDIVSYDKSFRLMEEHRDPGLLSISFWSSSQGLELFCPTTQKWIRPSADTIVLWGGLLLEKVTDGRLRAGVHRVVIDDSESRDTIWYEACEDKQIPWNIPTSRPSTVELPLISFSIQGLTGKREVFDRALTLNHYVEDVYELYQHRAGMPPPKTRLIYKGRNFDSYYQTLGAMGVEDNAVFYSVLSLRSGSDDDD